MCRNKSVLTKWQRARLEEIAEYDTKMNAIEEGHAKGHALGIIQGEENKTIEHIKNMLDDNLPIEKISLYTGKTSEEILEIKKS